MYKNPERVSELSSKIAEKESELRILIFQRKLEIEKLPDGYILIGPGDIVKPGAICFENVWYQTGNSVGHTLNEYGYVTGITKLGYKYANPIN